MTFSPTARPILTVGLSEHEFLRWYWLKTELEIFARELGIRVSGNKTLLTARIAASLGGREFAEPTVVRPTAGKQLAAPLTPTTTIPVGQRSSQVVRAWMREQVGEGFHFDAAMREFFAQSDGTKTMQDAVEHFYSTRRQRAKAINQQFEYNRFTRAWYSVHPSGSREALLSAWNKYRNTPVDMRGTV